MAEGGYLSLLMGMEQGRAGEGPEWQRGAVEQESGCDSEPVA